ncbi:MAG: glycosyltransferase [Bacteroidetes bacterium]|nr:glycosyltransferase [Bacteroidota bacterium]
MYSFTDWLNFYLVIFFGLYFLQSLLLIIGLFLDDKNYLSNSNESVTIIVSARNEENKIGSCLESLINIDYPKNLLEIIIIDDGSTDNTATIIKKYVEGHNYIKYLLAKGSNGNLKGKANALDQAIKYSSTDIIMITDADCVALPTWVSSTVKYFGKNVGIIAGFTTLDIKNWFHGIQSLDWSYILGMSASTINLKNPLSCIGNNYCFRKKAYNEVGGYKNIKFSVTEDFSLFTEIIKSGKWKYRFPMDHNRVIKTKPVETWIELVRQKRRWAIGGLEMKFSGLMFMVIAYIFHLLLVTVFIDNFISSNIFTNPIYFFASKIFIDFVFIFTLLYKFKFLNQLKYFLHFQIYFIFSLFLTPFTALFGGKVKWKGREF